MRPVFPLLGAALACSVLLAAAPPPELGRRGIVASDHRLASQAGADVLAAGGNAVDAAVATVLAAGVVQPAGSGLGGGGFAVLVEPDGQRHVLDFREVAPAASTRLMFVDAPKGASRKGGLAVGVPGEPAGLAAMHARWGRLPLKRVAAPASSLARVGFEVGEHLGHAIAGQADVADALSQLLFAASPPRWGDRVKRSALGRSIDAFAKTNGRAFTHGAIAKEIAQTVQSHGGIITAEDLATYSPRERAPMVGSYRGWTVVTMPPPSSGGAVLLQVLGVLEGLDLTSMEPGGAELLHSQTEAFKHAYADRARFMGDPDRVEVPTAAMLAPARIAEIQRDIVPTRTWPADHYGTAIDIGNDAGTQHISVMDDQGFSVSLTTTINTSFGSGVVAPRSGILLNNEMDDFVARPGEPNAFGLMGSEANAVSPGARPLSSMTPTVLISPDGRERIVVGGSGGPFIISSTLQVVVHIIDYGMDPSEAVAAPRIHHQWQPELLFVDAGLSPETRASLQSRGHTLKQMPFFSAVQVIHQRDGEMVAASDPRKGGWPAGVR